MTTVRRPNAVDRAPNRGRSARWAALALAGMCAAAAIVSTGWWVEFFARPQVPAETTLQGAQLWRCMLAVSAAALVAAMLLIQRLSPRHEPESRMAEGASRSRLYGMTGLILLGLIVRVTRINESLWYDEIASWQTYNGGTRGWGAVMGAFLDPINHTFHTLLNRWSVQWLVGDVRLEIAFRLPALVFSLATIPVMFGLGRAAASERVGWIAAMLAAIAPVCVLEGVEARGYAQMIFFSAAATWALIEALRRGAPWLWLLYAICCALGVWSQFLTAWIAIGHGAWIVWGFARMREQRSRFGQGFVAIALAGVLAIALYAPLIPGLLTWRANFAAASPDQPRILGPEGWHALLQLGGSWYWWAAIPGLLLLGVGLVRALRRQRLNPSHTIGECDVITLAMVGLPLMLIVVALSSTWLYARFMLFVMPGAMLAIALGIDAIWTRRASAGIAAMLILMAAAAADLLVRPSKQPLREAVAFVQQRLHEGDRVLAIGLAHDVLSIYGLELNIAHSFMFGRDLEAKLDSIQPRWVIVEYPRHVPEDRFQLLRSRGYEQAPGGEFRGWADWGHGDVLIFTQTDRRSSASGSISRAAAPRSDPAGWR